MGFEENPSKRPRLNGDHMASSGSPPTQSSGKSLGDGAMVLYSSGYPNQPGMNKGPPSMEELTSAPAICINVGPDQSQTTVQTNLFRGISEPLHQLLNSPAALNGDFSMINENLRHDDKAAFLQLTKMAYGIVLKGQGVAHANLAGKVAIPTALASGNIAPAKSPKCPDCKKPEMQLMFICLNCSPDSDKKDGTIGLKSFFEVQFLSSIEAASSQMGTAGGGSLLFPVDRKDPTSGTPYRLLHFVKVFTLANKYEVTDLKLSSFKAFQRRLKKISSKDLTEQHSELTEELIDALKYLAYTAPGGLSPPAHIVEVPLEQDHADSLEITQARVEIGTSDLLASLMRYIIIHIESLLKEDEFIDIVTEHGIIGLVLMNVLRQSMVSSEP